VGGVTVLILTLFGDPLIGDPGDLTKFIVLFVWIFGVILLCAFGVVRHADALAEILGEPLGTLTLTIAVIGIEVALIVTIMLTSEADPALARDTMFAILMIVLNGMVGVSLLVGGLRHREQEFNLQGAGAFLAVITSLATIALILPAYTVSTAEPTLSPIQAIAFSLVTLLLYGVFLAMQSARHRNFFIQPVSDTNDIERGEADAPEAVDHPAVRSLPYHITLLFLTMLPIVLLAKNLAKLVDYGVAGMGAPAAVGGVLIAVLVLAPEGVSAFKAAADRLQRSVNICLGSALSTIGMAVPAALVIGLVIGQDIVLGLDMVNVILLVLTLAVSMLTFGSSKTNMLQGAVHLVLFFVYLVLIFNP
jgi:Ca2+:H+ antiporter